MARYAKATTPSASEPTRSSGYVTTTPSPSNLGNSQRVTALEIHVPTSTAPSSSSRVLDATAASRTLPAAPIVNCTATRPMSSGVRGQPLVVVTVDFVDMRPNDAPNEVAIERTHNLGPSLAHAWNCRQSHTASVLLTRGRQQPQLSQLAQWCPGEFGNALTVTRMVCDPHLGPRSRRRPNSQRASHRTHDTHDRDGDRRARERPTLPRTKKRGAPRKSRSAPSFQIE